MKVFGLALLVVLFSHASAEACVQNLAGTYGVADEYGRPYPGFQLVVTQDGCRKVTQLAEGPAMGSVLGTVQDYVADGVFRKQSGAYRSDSITPVTKTMSCALTDTALDCTIVTVDEGKVTSGRSLMSKDAQGNLSVVTTDYDESGKVTGTQTAVLPAIRP
jgi:hypothetical protein